MCYSCLPCSCSALHTSHQQQTRHPHLVTSQGLVAHMVGVAVGAADLDHHLAAPLVEVAVVVAAVDLHQLMQVAVAVHPTVVDQVHHRQHMQEAVEAAPHTPTAVAVGCMAAALDHPPVQQGEVVAVQAMQTERTDPAAAKTISIQ